MEIEELKIGNWVLFNGYPVQIRELQYISKIDVYLDSNVNVATYKPMPLTEEILLKCGFETESKYDDFKLNGVNIQSCSMRCKTLERFSFYLNLGDENDELNNKIDYLHELQNLYYALTKKELDIKL